LERRVNALAKGLTHFSGVVALGYFVEADRFADCRRSRCGFPADLGRVQQQQTAASNSHASLPLEPTL
jgi:hypothetical protein